MLSRDAMICAKNKRLCVGYQDVDPLVDVIIGFALLGIDHCWVVLVPDLFDDIEGCQSIGLDDLCVGHVFLK